MSDLLQSLLRQVEEGDGPDILLDKELVAAFPSKGHRGQGPVVYPTHTIDAAICMAQRIVPEMDELCVFSSGPCWFAYVEENDGEDIVRYQGFLHAGIGIEDAPRAIVAAALRCRLKADGTKPYGRAA